MTLPVRDAGELEQAVVVVLQRGMPLGGVGRALVVFVLERRRRRSRNGPVATRVLVADGAQERYPLAVTHGGLVRRLLDSHDSTEPVAAVDIRLVAEVRIDGRADLTVEVERGRRLRAVEMRDVCLVDVRRPSSAIEVAGIRRQQLVDRRERACELGQVEELDLLPVHERVERIQRAAIGRAEGDERARISPAVEALEEVAGDQPAHRVADEHELRVAARRSRCASSLSQVWLSRCSLRAATRLSRRQSYGNSKRLRPRVTSNVSSM